MGLLERGGSKRPFKFRPATVRWHSGSFGLGRCLLGGTAGIQTVHGNIDEANRPGGEEGDGDVPSLLNWRNAEGPPPVK